MSYLVELHTTGGSMGEAVIPIQVVHVATKPEADAIAENVNNHPAAGNSEYLWAIVLEVPELVSVEQATDDMFDTYPFEDYDE